MKVSKSLFLAFAGLGLFACSNEDAAVENGNGIEGATVTVKFVGNALSRIVEVPQTGYNGESVPVEVKSGSIVLEAEKGGGKVEITSLDGNQTYTFSGVRVPKSIKVTVNDGQKEALTLAQVCNTGLAEPLYGESSTFTLDENKNYTVTVNLDRQIARLQFSGLDFTTEGSTYTDLTLDGVYLNGAYTTEGNTDYKLIANDVDAWNTVSTTWGENPVFDKIGAVVIGDGAVTGPWPKDDKCYAYNIFPATGEANLPKLTVCFSEAKQPNVIASDKRYARVAKYKLAGDKGTLPGVDENNYITEFKAGYIYNLTGLTLKDSDLGPTPDGGNDATVTATVTVTPWTLVNGTVEWQ